MNPLITVVDALRSHGCEPKENGTGWRAHCPAHDDRRPSLDVDVGNDGCVLLCCRSQGCGAGTIVSRLGLEMHDLFPREPAQNGCRPKASARKRRGWAYTTPQGAIAAARKQTGGQHVKTWVYHDADGAEVFRVARFDVPDGRKEFRPIHHADDGWRMGDPPGPLPLYRLPELGQKGTKHVFEGEKCVDWASELGLLATTSAHGSQAAKSKADWSPLAGQDVSIYPDNDEPGRGYAETVASILVRLRPPARVKIVELPGLPDHGDLVEFIEARRADGKDDAAIVAEIEALAEAAELFIRRDAESDDHGRPEIVIGPDEHRVVTETVDALTADPDLYQRGSMLVRVIREARCEHGIDRPVDSVIIAPVPQPNLRERMTKFATFQKHDRQGELVLAHPTAWLVAAVDKRAMWPGVRRLQGISDAPVLRPDGTISQTPGYDAVTGVLFEPTGAFPGIDPGIDLDDADAAAQRLLEVVCDFRFESGDHRAAWLAGVLTPLARFAFDGPAPLFLIDANVRGAGKTLLVQATGRIVLGRDVPACSYSHDSDEMRKKITALAIAGDRLVLLDNLEGSFGNGALDRAVTTTRWQDRILGKSEVVDLPLHTVWYATGNNVVVAADTTRRIIHIRLDVLEEHPEELTGFKHPDLLSWVSQDRGALLTSALTILAAYIRAGSPPQNLTPFGSFESWSRLVRSAIVWVGLPDPCATRLRLAEQADTMAASLAQLIDAWRGIDPQREGLVLSELLSRLYPAGTVGGPMDDASTAMRAAMENLVGCPAGRVPTARKLGSRLRKFRRRVIDGAYVDSDPNEKRSGGALWRLHERCPGRASDSGDSGD